MIIGLRQYLANHVLGFEGESQVTGHEAGHGTLVSQISQFRRTFMTQKHSHGQALQCTTSPPKMGQIDTVAAKILSIHWWNG